MALRKKYYLFQVFGSTLRFECSTCMKTFSSKSHLIRHEKTIHLGIFPYTCHLCGKGFVTKDHLKGHVSNHTGDHSYKCSVCSEVFTWKSTRDKHLRLHHPDVTVDKYANAPTPNYLIDSQMKSGETWFIWMVSHLSSLFKMQFNIFVQMRCSIFHIHCCNNVIVLAMSYWLHNLTHVVDIWKIIIYCWSYNLHCFRHVGGIYIWNSLLWRLF